MTKERSPFETFAKRTPKISVLTDQPLSAEQIRELFESDPFNFRYKLGPVYDILRHKKPNTKTEQMPTAVLITGDWGTGKTTAMKWLECLLIQWNKRKPEDVSEQDYIKTRPLWFYPWKYDKKEDGSVEVEVKVATKPNVDLGDYKALIPAVEENPSPQLPYRLDNSN